MKIIAQSTTSTKVPFVHLGYTAAAEIVPKGLVVLMAFVFFLSGLTMFFKKSKILELGIKKFDKFIEKKRALFGIILFIISLLAVVAVFIF